MVTVGFVVEGASEKRLVESELFQKWLREDCNLEVVDPVVDAAGGGNMCSRNIKPLVKGLRIQANPDKVVVLADLDPDGCVQCVRERKKIIGSQDIDLVAIARKALESWFLADTKAMRRWLGDDTFCEVAPETLAGMPWDRLRRLRDKDGQGPGPKISFSKKIILDHGFDVRRAARHAQCPSANYFVERLCALGNPRQRRQHKEEDGSMTIQLKSADQTHYDAIALGEVLMRIDPGQVPTARARTARIWHGGGETNVAEGLSYCFGLRAAVITALVDDGIGRNIENQLREAGLDTGHIIWFNNSGKGQFSTDAKGTLHNGINFTWAGKGLLPSVTEYYRAHAPVREIGPSDVDWDHLFGELGTRWFSTGGIYTLLSEKTAALALEAMQKAGEHGAGRSFDLNYRSKVEPDKERARQINRSIVPHVEFLVGNQDDFDDALGYETEQVAKDASFDQWLTIYTKMLHQVANDYPNLKYIGTQLRGALTADRINWGAVLFDVEEGEIYQAAVRENIEIADRTGGGDSFASGVIAALLDGRGAADAVQWGAAHGILVQECIGDTTMVSRDDVEKEVARALKGGGVSALR